MKIRHVTWYRNLQDVFDSASGRDRSLGMTAYQDYNYTMRSIAEHYGMEVATVAGCFAALSPNNDYRGNLRSCVTLCEGWTQGYEKEECPVTTYNHNRDKAWKLLDGAHFYGVFKGLKVRNFWRNLTEPYNPEAVTIDGHMANLMEGELKRLDTGGISKREYEAMASVVRRLAKDKRVLASQVQSVTWFAWKRRHGIKMNDQAWLWDDIEEVRPRYEIKDVAPYKFRRAEVVS